MLFSTLTNESCGYEQLSTNFENYKYFGDEVFLGFAIVGKLYAGQQKM